MTQSDSPDFEFDISDLEVERDDSAASMDGSTASADSEELPANEVEQVAEEETIKSDSRAGFDEADRELDVFEIDDLPSADEPVPAAEIEAEPSPEALSDSSENVEENVPVESATEPSLVQKVEEKADPKPSRVLGEDDLGADVFAEIETELDSLGLDDVIDDLMDEVEDYEAGGFVELDKESESKESSDGLFKMDDPDDSLQNSVDPNAVDEEPVSESPSFPSPPSDFEIPADPEPPKAESVEVDEVPPVDEPEEEVVLDEAPPVVDEDVPAPAKPDFSDFEIPADPASEQTSEKESPVEDSAPTEPTTAPEPVAESVPEPVVVNEPEPVVEAVSEAAPEVSVEAEPEVAPKIAEPVAEVPEAAPVPPVAEADPVSQPEEPAAPVAEVEEEQESEPVAPVEGREQVFYSAEDEEEQAPPVPEDSVEEQDVSDLLASVAEEVEEPEAIVEDIEEPVEEAIAPTEESPSLDPVDEPTIQAEEPAVQEISEEEEEDLSALLDAIEDEDSESDSPVVEPEPAAEETEVSVEDPAPVPAESEEEAIEGLVEVSEEEEDISDLVASALEEEEPAESIEDTPGETIAEVSEEVPGLIEVEEEEIPGLQEVSEEEVPEEAVESADDEEDVLMDLPSPEDLIVDDSEEEPEPAVPEVPGLVEVDEDLDEEDISNLIGAEEESTDSPAEEASAPSLGVIDDDEEEEVMAMPVPEVPGLVEVEDEEEAVEPETKSPAKAPPSAEDLLMQAGSLLNGDSEKPADGASALLDVIDDDDDEEIVELPSPDAMIADATDDEDEVVALPDPSSLMTADGEAVAVIEDEDEEDIPAPGNVADRAGDLPPPPPAPVEIIDEEPPEEDTQAAEPVAESSDTEEDGGSEALEDPFASEISLDDFNEGFEELEVEEEAAAEVAEGEEGEDTEAEAGEGEPKKEVVEKVVEMPKPSLLWRVTHSMAVAAGLVLVGLAGVLFVWKQQIVEYYDGRDIDGSALLLEIEEIGTHALSEFDKNGLYRMQWVDSEVRRVSTNEIRLHAVVGARLRENLYRPVMESQLKSEKGYDEETLLQTLSYARDHFPEEIGNFPDRPWDRLFEISAKKEEVLPLRVTYALKRESKEADWALARIKVSGYKGDLEWPEGEPKHTFGENAYDVNSLEFAKVYEDYRSASEGYVARIDRLKAREEDGVLALKRENQRQRERVKMALAEGAFFNGLAIVGEDAAESQDVQLVITEVRNDGGFVKGVVTLAGEKEKHAKHFVGSLQFEKTMSGREQGYLSLKTVSITAPGEYTATAPFFEADNVSRMRLKADGFRLEGDSRDLSFRLTRSL